jgi:hypothetical protein
VGLSSFSAGWKVMPFQNTTRNRAGAKARHSFGYICGLAEAMPLLQSSGFVEFFSKL